MEPKMAGTGAGTTGYGIGLLHECPVSGSARSAAVTAIRRTMLNTSIRQLHALAGLRNHSRMHLQLNYIFSLLLLLPCQAARIHNFVKLKVPAFLHLV